MYVKPMRPSYIGILALLLAILGIVSAHPNLLPCTRTLTAGTTIMAGPAVSSSSRSVVIMRGSTALASGDAYLPGETLTVSISTTGGEYVFEALGGAAFASGTCTSTRSPIDKAGTLVMPSSGTVTVKVAWATQYGIVSISDMVTLVAGGASPTASPTQVPVATPTNAPVASPSAIPTFAPSQAPSFLPTFTPSEPPTHAPTLQPTAAVGSPTAQPTTGAPTSIPTARPSGAPSNIPTAGPSTIGPTALPSEAPTQAPVEPSSSPTPLPTTASMPTVTPTTEPTVQSFSDGNRRKVAIGVAFAVGGPLAGGLFAPYVAGQMVVAMYTISCVVLGMIACGLVAAWATDNDVAPVINGQFAPHASNAEEIASYGFLGRPDWTTNPFAYHPVLMVAGFYLSLIFALLVKTVFPQTVSRVPQIIFNTVAVICLLVGLGAITKYRYVSYTPRLTSLHSWLGIASCVCLTGYVFVACLPVSRATQTLLNNARRGSYGYQDALNSQVVDHRMRVVRLTLEVVLIFVVTLTILTGISIKMGQCYYINTDYGSDPNPALHYDALPTACKLSFGVGILTVIISLLASVVVIYKSSWVAGESEDSQRLLK
jgi:hypothetical protein